MPIDPVKLEAALAESDPRDWGHSMARCAELLISCMEAAQVKSVVEIGALAGDLTRVLLLAVGGRHGSVCVVDPLPRPALEGLADQDDRVTLIRELSVDALEKVDPADCYVIDGDHNWYTVGRELQLVFEARGPQAAMPLVLLHDVCWPHGRRDDYCDPLNVPKEARQTFVEGGGLLPGDGGLVPGGLPYKWPAATEGGPRNGVLTAAEDFVASRTSLRLAVIPVFFGLGVLWDERTEWAGALAEVVDEWDQNPVLARLEANRVKHLTGRWVETGRRQLAENELALRDELLHRRALFLERLVGSRAFRLAARLSAIRGRGQPAFSVEEARELLDDPGF